MKNATSKSPARTLKAVDGLRGEASAQEQETKRPNPVLQERKARNFAARLLNKTDQSRDNKV